MFPGGMVAAAEATWGWVVLLLPADNAVRMQLLRYNAADKGMVRFPFYGCIVMPTIRLSITYVSKEACSIVDP
jgi:hypothetical protein